MNGDSWKVYAHVNKKNGKVYIGITSKEKPEHRWNSGRGYKENPHFYSAILKYGWENFSHLILYEGLDESMAKTKEIELIKVLKSNNPEFGYNLTTGGDGTPGFHPSEETRRKLSEARRKENLSEETLKRRSDKLRGRRFTPEHKRKIGDGNSKPVLMLNIDGTLLKRFPSATEAERRTNIHHSHISQCCNGHRNTAGGYRWQFA